MTDEKDDRRLSTLVDHIVQLASGDLNARLEPSPAGDSIDAVIVGINLFADEIQSSQRKLQEARCYMEHLALNDPLTGLANRTLLGERILEATSRPNAISPCVLLLDLDGFKTINDGLGHEAGDRVLVEVARRLKSVVRNTDTVARLGGDEFAILMPDAGELEAFAVARRALVELQKPFSVADRPVWTGASIGLCRGMPGQTADLLLRDADIAMYEAKAKGRANIQVFRPDMQQAALERLRVASELGSAIADGQLVLHYQPIVELLEGRIVGAEALVRWAHPERGLLPPDQFMTVANDSGHIIDLGQWVVRNAISQLGFWQSTLPSEQPFQLHVNLSPVEVRWPGIAELIRNALRNHAVPPSRLALEISETGLMTGDPAGLEALLTLQKLGVGIEIDDFGTGYSSISYLRRLPIDTVKVDQSLIRELSADGRQANFVGAILRLIESVGLRAIVEGIGTASQLHQLRELGCYYGQGYHFSKPVPAEQMTQLLTHDTARSAAARTQSH